MSLALVTAVALVVAAPSPEGRGPEVSIGARDWGLGIELPRVGLMGGFGERSRLGFGYALGAGLSYAVAPRWLLSLRVVAGQAYDGEARLRYLDAGGEVGVDVSADWLGLETSLGLVHLFRRTASGLVPYVGFEGGWGYGGFDYRLPDDVAAKLEPPSGTQTSEELCSVLRCTSVSHTAIGGFALAGLRAGLRFVFTDWLSTEVELTATLVRLGRESLASTTAARDAHAVEQTVFLLRPTFTARVGL